MTEIVIKADIIELQETKYKDLTRYFENRRQDEWNLGPDGKWTSGQHVLHLQQSLDPLLKALRFPDFILKYKFGKANRPSRSYDDVVNWYHEKLVLAEGAVSPFSIKMPSTPPKGKAEIISKYGKSISKLQLKIAKYSDKALDTLLMPHPLMGRMTLREMFMWHAYHIEHHKCTLESKY